MLKLFTIIHRLNQTSNMIFRSHLQISIVDRSLLVSSNSVILKFSVIFTKLRDKFDNIELLERYTCFKHLQEFID